MKIETRYVCEICGEKYEKPADAEACEAKGPAADIMQFWPVGMLIPRDAGDKLALAVAERRPYMSGHLITTSYWAARDNGAGDSLGELCGGDLHSDKPGDYYARPLDLTTPYAQRLLAYLKKKGITPTRWDGEKIVPVEL
jgi:hypothetical protein